MIQTQVTHKDANGSPRIHWSCRLSSQLHPLSSKTSRSLSCVASWLESCKHQTDASVECDGKNLMKPTWSVSGYSTTMYAYIGEFNTDRHRTVIISWITVAIGLVNVFIPSKIISKVSLNFKVSNIFCLLLSVSNDDSLLRLDVWALPWVFLSSLAVADDRLHNTRNHRCALADYISWESAVFANEKSQR